VFGVGFLSGLQCIYDAKCTPHITGKFDWVDLIRRNVAHVLAVMILARVSDEVAALKTPQQISPPAVSAPAPTGQKRGTR
jgi:hypothetical protein